jgi:hypothetical protein
MPPLGSPITYWYHQNTTGGKPPLTPYFFADGPTPSNRSYADKKPRRNHIIFWARKMGHSSEYRLANPPEQARRGYKSDFPLAEE